MSACATVIHSSLSCRWYSSETKITTLLFEWEVEPVGQQCSQVRRPASN
ncbi:Uncharacterised protein [Vibrio cholerae]|nr:Uncharacterised protein [Vibrio cholerae]